MSGWKAMLDRYHHPESQVKVALVGKYVALRDAYLSVAEALTHAGIAQKAAVSIGWINSESVTGENADKVLGGFDGIIVPGGYGDRGAEGIIAAAAYARQHRVPYLAIGFGMQLSVAEACRHLLNLSGANSLEVDPQTPHPVVYIPEGRQGLNGNRSTARMGAGTVRFQDGLIRSLYASETALERHGNRFEVAPIYVGALAEKGFLCVGWCEKEGYPEAFEIKDHPFYAAVLYHPEFLSRPDRAHPLFSGFIRAAITK